MILKWYGNKQGWVTDLSFKSGLHITFPLDKYGKIAL